MKIGDKVYCIIEYSNPRLNKKIESGKFYTVEFIVDFYRGEHRTYFATIGNVTFSLYNKPFSRNFSDHFISNTDYRKMKLNQLNKKIEYGDLQEI